MKSKLALALATWFGAGLAPKGPGTAGSLGALLAAWPLAVWAGWAPWHFPLLAALLLLPAVWAASVTARERGVEDPQIVVIDEVLGQWLALAGAARFSLWEVAAAFVLFRIFDIVKPWPVRQAESLPGGAGIVADDLLAGLYAAAVLAAARAALRIMVQS